MLHAVASARMYGSTFSHSFLQANMIDLWQVNDIVKTEALFINSEESRNVVNKIIVKRSINRGFTMDRQASIRLRSLK